MAKSGPDLAKTPDIHRLNAQGGSVWLETLKTACFEPFLGPNQAKTADIHRLNAQ
jgi:hypothetical protein